MRTHRHILSGRWVRPPSASLAGPSPSPPRRPHPCRLQLPAYRHLPSHPQRPRSQRPAPPACTEAICPCPTGGDQHCPPPGPRLWPRPPLRPSSPRPPRHRRRRPPPPSSQPPDCCPHPFASLRSPLPPAPPGAQAARPPSAPPSLPEQMAAAFQPLLPHPPPPPPGRRSSPPHWPNARSESDPLSRRLRTGPARSMRLTKRTVTRGARARCRSGAARPSSSSPSRGAPRSRPPGARPQRRSRAARRAARSRRAVPLASSRPSSKA
mmetsp:Transcript_40919/g.127483  ORF Transcript_40919/g.127483 Transcript_40919/m.127483 type:complete len:266 (+) Transcript_40919:2147-2944(+)